MPSIAYEVGPVKSDPRRLSFDDWCSARSVDFPALDASDDPAAFNRLMDLEDEYDAACQAALDGEVNATETDPWWVALRIKLGRQPTAADVHAEAEREQEEAIRDQLKEAGADTSEIAQAIARRRWKLGVEAEVIAAGRPYADVYTEIKARDPRRPRELVIGSNPEVAQRVIDEHLRGAIADEGNVWIQDAAGLWRAVDPNEIARWTYAWDGAIYINPEGKPRTWKANATNSVLADIHKKLAVRDFFSKAPPGVPFINGFLNGKTRELVPLSEARCRWCLPFEYAPGAARKSPPRRWRRFITSIWGEDKEAIDLLHQILGYLLSGRTDLQKIFLFVGPPRGGKGTVFRLIKRMFQDQAGAFKVNRLENEFGLACLLGKLVAYDQDVRASTSHLRNVGQVVERLLGISGEDEQNVPRKNLDDLILTLGVRLMLGSNPPFGLSDVTGALATRLVILRFPESFLGREETDLDDALAAELPAIVDLALAALGDLEVAGRFVEPKSSAEERASVERIANPMLGFLEDRCELGADFQTGCDELFRAACAWRLANGHKNMSAGAFADFLRARGIPKTRPYVERDGKQVRGGGSVYKGVRLMDPVAT